MKLPFIALPLLAISLMACSEQKTNMANQNTVSQANESKPKNDTSPQTVIGDNSQNALDWNGRYLGVAPCGDCEGINTVLILNLDNTYKLDTQYLGKSDKIFTETGRVEWNQTGGKITLITLDKDEPGNQYLVGENQLVMLDRQGNKIKGELAQHYRLTKEQ